MDCAMRLIRGSAEGRISMFATEGPLLAVGGHCHTDNYRQVCFEINKIITYEFGKAGYPVPDTPQVQRQVQADDVNE